MFDFIENIFIGLLTIIVNASNHIKHISLKNVNLWLNSSMYYIVMNTVEAQATITLWLI